MSIKPEQMNEDKLNAFLDNELRQCIGWAGTGDEIQSERAENLNMYLNRPVGDEEIGRSQVQSSDVSDVIESLLPATLAPFISTDKVAEFKPVSPEDEEYAELASAYVDHIFFVDNDGMKIHYEWQKDGLLQKNGFVYVDWTEEEKTKRIAQKVDFFGLTQLMNDDEIEVIEYAGMDMLGNEIAPDVLEAAMEADGVPPELVNAQYEIDYRRRWTEGRVKIENIAPEYVLVSKTAKDEATANLIGWQEEVTLSQLREEGYSEDKLEKIQFDSETESDIAGESTAREQAQGGQLEDYTSTDPASRKVWRTVVWTMVDYDGDGKAELRKIIRSGQNQAGGVILHNEEADWIPIVSFTPCPMPHQLFGRATADQTREVQRAKTAMLRMGMDATYATVRPRMGYIEELAGDDTYDDLLLDQIGLPIRMARAGAVQPIGDAPNIGAAYQMLEYWDRVRELRTPVSRQDQGVQNDALQNKTAAQANIEANASSQKKELILRLYAEALGRLCKLVNKTVIKHQDKPRLLRLFPNKPPMNIDPRYWNADMDVTVSVGLGSGTKEQSLQAIMNVLNEQKFLMQAQSPLYSPDKMYNAYERLVEYAGLCDADRYFVEPQQEGQQQITPQMLQQAQQQAFQQGVQQAQDQTKIMEIQSDEKLKERELDIKETDMRMKHGIDMADLQIRQEENVAQAMGYNV